MSLVVGVESPAKLLLGAAHAVGAVGAADGVVLEAFTGGVVVAADVVEERFVFAAAGAGVDDAGERVVHAFAELFVRRGGERCGFRVEAAAFGGAGGGRVGRRIVG